MISIADGGRLIRQLPAGRGAQERPPPYVSARNRPAREAEAPSRRVPFSNFGDHRSGAALPKIFSGIFFSGVLGFLDARRGGAGHHPVYAGRGPGALFQIFWVPAWDPSHFFWTSPMRSARQAMPSPPTPPATNLLAHLAREGRTTNLAGDESHAQAQAVLPVSPSREALFPSRYRPAGLRLRSGRPRATGSPSAATTIGIVSVAFWQQSPILVRLARDR